MKKCPFCNSEIADYATTCRFCGEKLGRSPAPGAYGAPPQQSGSQVITLIMGILGLCCFPFGVVAIILWASHRSKVKRGVARPDGTATVGLVLAIIGLAINLLMIVGFAVALSMREVKESGTTNHLATIVMAQERYRSANDSYASQLSQLEQYGIMPSSYVEWFFGYRVKLNLSADGSEWSCVATPVRPGTGENRLHYFYIDKEGVVRYSQEADVGPDSPEYSLGQYQGFQQPPGRDR